MRPTGLLAALALCLVPTAGAAFQPAAESPLPPPERTPQLVINHAGPHAPIQSLAFAPDGTLYAGGYGKLVHRYVLRGGQFVAIDPIRVPLGPGNAGAVNAVAVSPDGKWVAVAGRAPIRGELWSGSDDGLDAETRHFPTLLKQDYGVVYLFNPADPQGGKVIRGPESGVRALAFADPAPATGPVLVTAGVEWDADGKRFGVVRVFDVATGKELRSRTGLPATPIRPGLAAWAGDGGKVLRVAAAWPKPDNAPGELLVWDVTPERGQALLFDDGRSNVALAVRAGKNGAELVSGGMTDAGGRLMVRPAGPPAGGKPLAAWGQPGPLFYPLAVALVGDKTAVVLRDYPRSGESRPAATELRLIGAKGETTATLPLTGTAPQELPPLAASPDGKWVAVSGFADHRIEVYDAATLRVQKLAGAPGGFARVAFLAENRLWLGGPTDTAPRGGLVFDPGTRTVTAGGDGKQIDAPPGGGPTTWTPVVSKDAATKEETVTLTTPVTGAVKFTLLTNEKPTAAAYLPAGPAWDKTLGGVLAVAHHNQPAAVSLITLFDAKDGRRLFRLNGPTLRVEGLAFSGSRPLLAAVGADRVVSVWTLKNLVKPFAVVEGVALVERKGELTVAAVEPTSPARDALKPDAVIEAVGGEKGELTPVKTYREFLLAVREVGVGGTARVRLKGNAAAVVVPVGRGVGHRHPLFDLWVDPAANKGGTHDWIAWTPAGPYDANSLAAEARLGWLNATGNPAEPVRYAAADQYRKPYYKTDFFRLLVAEADFDGAFERHRAAYPVTPPTLTVRADATDRRDGVSVVRTKPETLGVRLNDPDGTLPPGKRVLRWRAVGRDGKPGKWQELPFAGGRATIPLAGYAWSRGPHRFEVALHETFDPPVGVEAPPVVAAETFHYAPPPPVLAVRVDKKPFDGREVPSDKESVEVSAEVKAAAGEDVVVTLTNSGPGGDKAVTLAAGTPVSVQLNPESKTGVRVTAVNAGAGEYERYESAPPVDVVVRHAAPRPKIPQVRLSVASPVDPPAAPGTPFVSDTPTVRLSAAVEPAGEVTKLEWDDGDGKWVVAEYKPADPKAPVVTRDVAFAEGGKPRPLRVRVTAAGGSRTDQVAVVWAGLPTVEFTGLPDVVRDAGLTCRCEVRLPTGGPAFDLRVVVEPTAPGAARRVIEARSDKPGVWLANLRLAAGENRVGLVVSNPWKEGRSAVREVRYVRPPLVASAAPIAARGAGVGDVAVAVVSPGELPPLRLTVGGRPVPTKPSGGPVPVLGLTVWWLKAEAVPLGADGVLPKAVRVSVGNADGDGPEVDVAVLPKPVAPPPPPPRIAVIGPNRVVLAAGENVRTDQPELAINVTVKASVRLTRVELHRPDAVGGSQDLQPNGSESVANPKLLLREGVNRFEVVATTGDKPATFPFSVSYTPPPIRVEIDAVEEASPDGKLSALPKPYQAADGVVRVRGRVIWSETGEATRGAGHEVVLVANEVRHLPVALTPPAASSRESSFTAPLFLNAADTQVRVEVLAGGRVAVPQQKVADETVAVRTVAVRTRRPLGRQRLHVLVIAPGVPEDRRARLAREVVTAVGGEFPAGRPVSDGMEFRHQSFERAVLYAPLVDDVKKGGIFGLLESVEAAIRRSAGQPGPDAWVNDVVLVYYQGRDLTGADNRLRLHTTRSLHAGAAAEQHAVRLDELPPTPGVRLRLLNVVDPDGRPRQGDPLDAYTLLLRYPSKNADGVGDLLLHYQEAVARQTTVGGVVDRVGDRVTKSLAYPPTVSLAPAVRDRPLSGDR